MCGKDYFSIQIDVGNFRPEELKVTVIENQVVIEGKHDEKSDNFGQVERYFVRKYSFLSTPPITIAICLDTTFPRALSQKMWSASCRETGS